MRELKLNIAEEQKAKGLGEVHRDSSTGEIWKIPDHYVTYVIPGIIIFEKVWSAPAWDSLLHDTSPSQFPDRKTKGQKMRTLTSVLIIGRTAFLDSCSVPHPATFLPLSTREEAQWVVLPSPLPFTEVALLGNNPQAVLCSCKPWTPSRRIDPKSQESKGKSSHLHVGLCLINFKWIFQCFICSWTDLQHPAISLKWICSTQENGMQVTLIWGYRQTSETVDWTAREH